MKAAEATGVVQEVAATATEVRGEEERVVVRAEARVVVPVVMAVGRAVLAVLGRTP